MTTTPRTVNPWLVAVSVMFATFMEVLDTTVVNVSLPHIAGSLSSTIDEATWALTSYLVANAIILPMTGWLASHPVIGRMIALATRYDVSAQVASSMVDDRLPAMWGSDTLTTVVSSTSMKVANMTDTATSQGFTVRGVVVIRI